MPFLLALAAVACQEGNITPESPVVSNEMSFDILAPGVQTKVANNAFEATDVIGLYVTDYVNEATAMPLQISGNRANNITVTYDGAAWTPEKTIFWGSGKSDIYAYYPYFEEVKDVDSQYFEVATDQTTDGYEASDFLWAKAEGVSQTDGTVSLQMKHVMSKLTVKLVAGEDYVGSLPDDASVLLHSTVTGARVDLSKGSVSKDPYSGAKSIKMKKLGTRTFEEGDALVYEAIVVPQLLQTSVPLLEINSKSVSYLLEDSFNFRPGVTYTYTVTLNTSTTAIKVEIGCELEDWNSAGGGDSGEGGESGDGGVGEGDDDGIEYIDLSENGTANCYLIQGVGNYKFKTVIGSSSATVGNVKSVDVLWESFGTDKTPNVGDLIASVAYKNGYIYFSTPENFNEGNSLIAARNSKGKILWSWHIWCSEEGWQEQVYNNDAGILMDRNLGATSSTPGDIGALGLLYQWGRKDPFLGKSTIGSSSTPAASTGTWYRQKNGTSLACESNPTTFYQSLKLAASSWLEQRSMYNDPCPAGWRVPSYNFWSDAGIGNGIKDNTNGGILFDDCADSPAWYPFAGYRDYSSSNINSGGFYWSVRTDSALNYNYVLDCRNSVSPSSQSRNAGDACSVRCQKI